MKALGIDIGGSAVKGAPVDVRTGRLLAERVRIATPRKLKPIQMARVVGQIVGEFRWKGPVGVGFPGVVHGSHILAVGNLHQDFVGWDAGTHFAKATGCPVAVTNDAAAAAMAEMKFGAGRGFLGKTLVLTLGTGLGSAIALDGVVVPCEFGHFPRKGKPIERWMAASAKKREDLSWKKWARRVNWYLQVLERMLWPERILIGGGVSADNRKFFKYLHTRAKLMPAEFFNEAGIVGAALWGHVSRQRERP